MRNTLKSSTLEQKFPILAVENDCIISKNADVTIAYQLELPEVFTVTSPEYEIIHATWCKAIRLLPNYTIVHKQDWFENEKYQIENQTENSTFLNRSFEKHFYQRPYLKHTCYVYIVKTSKIRATQKSNVNMLTRKFVIPAEVQSGSIAKFVEAVQQFERIINDCDFLQLTRLTNDDIVGTEEKAGIIEKYFSLSQQETTCLQDVTLKTGDMKIGDKHVCLHTLSETNDLPSSVYTDCRHEKMSTDKSECRLSFAAPLGLLLACDHIYNQYIFIDDSQENLKKFEQTARNMHSLSRYSRSNQINSEWIEEYLNEAHSNNLTSVRAHYNIFAWSSSLEQLKNIKSEVGSQIASLGCIPRHNTVNTPTLFWAGIPGGEGDFPFEESFYTFIEQGVCLFSQETNYKSSLSAFGIRMTDRLNGLPIHLDISDLPMKKGIITNRNKFVLGPSGSGKSFFTNHMVRQYYEQGAHIVLVDTGNSYEGLNKLIHYRTQGEDGIYFTYTEDNPISFNPFYNESYQFDIEKKESLKTLLLTLWKREDEMPKRSEETELSKIISQYIELIKNDRNISPCFNTFYEYVRDVYQATENVRDKEFDIINFLKVLEPYYKGGEFDFLLNSDKEIDLLGKRFIVFEIDAIKDHKILFPVVTIIIMDTFINKMRRLKGVRKMILIEEAWKAIAKAGMADYIKYLFKTIRKFFGEAVVVTQEIDDIISSPVVKDTIINNSDCKILLDQRKYVNSFERIQEILGLTNKEVSQILSINTANNSDRFYKEVWIGLGGMQSAVYGTEVSLEEYFTYTTEETEKLAVWQLAEKMNGNFELAIRQVAENLRKNNL